MGMCRLPFCVPSLLFLVTASMGINDTAGRFVTGKDGGAGDWRVKEVRLPDMQARTGKNKSIIVNSYQLTRDDFGERLTFSLLCDKVCCNTILCQNIE